MRSPLKKLIFCWKLPAPATEIHPRNGHSTGIILLLDFRMARINLCKKYSEQ
jgi:hypothetical protein